MRLRDLRDIWRAARRRVSRRGAAGAPQFSRGAGVVVVASQLSRDREREVGVTAGGKLVVHGGRAKMPPKKREKDLDGQKGPRMDQIQADHELFLQAFESK